MNKEDSLTIKGILILMMLYLHLFNDVGRDMALFSLFHVGREPSTYVLSRAAGPVEFYLKLGGYGLYGLYEQRRDKNHYRRVWKCIVLVISTYVLSRLFWPLVNVVIGIGDKNVYKRITKKNIKNMNNEIQFILYQLPDEEGKVQVVIKDETIWATQKAIAQLFGVGIPAISKHLNHIIK